MSMTNPYGTPAQAQALAHQRAEREEREAEAAAEQQRRVEENRKIRDARLKALDDKKVAERAERLAAEDREFVATLRRRYMSSDVTATEADFQRDLPELRRLHRLNAAVHGPSDSELAAARRDASQYF